MTMERNVLCAGMWLTCAAMMGCGEMAGETDQEVAAAQGALLNLDLSAPVVSLCGSGPPDATITMGPNTPQQLKISTGQGAYGAAYASPFCFRYVVDVVVPWNTSGGPNYLSSFVFETFSNEFFGTESVCENYRQNTSVYLQSGSTFNLTQSATYEGHWSQGECKPQKTSGDAIGMEHAPPPPSTTRTYRIATGGRLNGVYKQMYVLAKHLYHP